MTDEKDKANEAGGVQENGEGGDLTASDVPEAANAIERTNSALLGAGADAKWKGADEIVLPLDAGPGARVPRRRPPPRGISEASNDSSISSTTTWFGSISELFHQSPMVIPLPQLRKLASQGNLDTSHRGLSWRILLGYLDASDRSTWKNHVQQQRQLYQDFCAEIFVHPMDRGYELKQHNRHPRRLRQQQRQQLARALNEQQQSQTHASETQSSSTTTTSPPSLTSLPLGLQEAWKRNGRDLHVLESLTSGVNALRFPTNNNNKQQEQPKEEVDDVSFYQDFIATATLLDEIRKDIVRTCADLAFYLDPVLGTRRYAVLERILLIWAKFNKPVRYVQGMNEIVAVLYFVLTSMDEEEEEFDYIDYDSHSEREHDHEDTNKHRHHDHHDKKDTSNDDGELTTTCVDPKEGKHQPVDLDDSSCCASSTASHDDADHHHHEDEDDCYYWADHAEPDAYWLFHSLLSEMSDVFVPDLDSAETGIQGRISAMEELLKRHDSETAEHLQEMGINASFYAIRWWTTLLSREFLLPDTIRLWDSMFASTRKDNFIRYVCVTMVLLIRDLLLKADFSTCLRMLQSYPSTNMENLLQSSRALWIYESQITVACHRGGIGLHQALQTIAPPPGVIFAFGLRGGSILLQQEEQQLKLQQQTLMAQQKVREATQAVASQAQVFFGRARGFYSRSLQEYRKYRDQQQQQPADQNDNEALASSVTSSSPPDDDANDSIYMDAILKAP